MKAKLRRIYAAVMALAITISLVTVPVQAAEAPQFSDVDGHWGEEAIVRWADYGVIEGSNGQFNPDAPITRAEMAAAIARLLGLTETAENTFTDVEADAWYAQAILQCAAAGIIQGSNGMANPNGTLTRQEAAVMLGRALGIQPDEGDVAFLDGEQVAGWAAGYVSVMSDRGILNGVGGNQFAPLEDINRASVVTVLNNAITAYANEPGATVQASGGIALVVAGDVTVTGTAEDVLIVAGGDVTVAADVSGSVTVSAEGAGVTVAENAVVGTVAVSGGSAAVTVEADASVSTLAVAESASGASVTVAADAAVETVTVAAPESSVTVSGSVGAVEAAEAAGNADITVGADAAVDSITTAAAGTDITVSGTVETVTVAGTAGSTTVTANRGAEITSVDNSAEDVTISGSGTVESVTTSGNDTAINTDGTELTVAEGVTGTTENNKDVDAGETTTTKRPSSGGGGSSSGGGSTHSHSYTDGVCSCGAYDPAWRQVNSVETWNTAIAAGAQNIVITGDFTAATQLTVTRAAAVAGTITINGNGKTITSQNNATNAGDAAGILVAVDDVVVKNLTVSGPNNTDAWDNGEYGIKIYNADNVTLQNVTVTAANAGIQVNSSTVTLAGTVTVSGNEWGGIEVCKSSNEDLTAGILNINGATVVCTDTAVPAIWIDGTTGDAGVVNGAENKLMWVTLGDQIYYYPAGTNITITGEKTLNWNLTVENLTVAEGATLTVADGYTLEVTDTLTNNGTITGNGTVVAPGYAKQDSSWVKLFNGGTGTEADPYQVANAEQLAATGKVSGTVESPIYVRLNSDIDLASSGINYGIYQLENVVLDGDGKQVYSSQDKKIYGLSAFSKGRVEIRDLTYNMNNLTSSAFDGLTPPLIYAAEGSDYSENTADSLVFDTVTVTGSAIFGGNCGAFITYEYMPEGSELKFINCTYDADTIGTGYNACFIGWQYPKTSTVDDVAVSVGPKTTFDSCKVTGTLVSNQAAIIAANGTNAGIREYVFSNNSISGTVRGTEEAKYFTAVAHTNHTELEERAKASFTTSSDMNVYVGATDNSLAINVNSETKKIELTPSDNENVTKYKVEVGIYTNIYDDEDDVGTWLFFAEREFDAQDIEEISMYAYDFIDSAYSGIGEISTDTNGNKIASLNDVTYYVVEDHIDDSGNQGYVGGPNAPAIRKASIIRVIAYVGEEMYSSVSYK